MRHAAPGGTVRGSLDLLEKTLGRPRRGRRHPPLDELVLTVLSQHTSDINRDRAYAALRSRFPSWEDVLRARRADVETAIRAGGLARTKSRVIQDILRRVLRDQGRLDLGVLKTLPLAAAKAYLRGLRGVGEKRPAACCCFPAAGRPFPWT
ncbi:MAG: endonuclease III, partial [Acidobacteriota bacterium]